MGTRLNKTLLAASMLLSASFAQASSYTYEIQQNWTNTPDETVYGTMAELYITVDNGNSTNQSQTYSWANVTGLEVHTNGTFSAIWDWPSRSFGTDALSSFTDTLFATDATGNQANFQWNGGHYLLSSATGYFLQFASSGTVNWTNLYVSDNVHGSAVIHPWADNLVGKLENSVPEPASIALLALGFLGFGVKQRRNQQA